jgi:hypothetical protein
MSFEDEEKMMKEWKRTRKIGHDADYTSPFSDAAHCCEKDVSAFLRVVLLLAGGET